MKISEIINIVDGELICGHELLDNSIEYGYSCDLMSDVLAYVQSSDLLLTGLVHPQVIRTAEMLDLKAIIFVRGKVPSEELVEMAIARDLILVRTKHSLFTASGLLYQKGLRGEEITHDEIPL
jgi:predicted transcriptional regulator